MRALRLGLPGGSLPQKGSDEARGFGLRWCTSCAGRYTPSSAVGVAHILPGVLSASPSPPRYRVVGAKVGAGKVLCPPLDCGDADSLLDSVQRFVKPPPICGPPDIHACTDSGDDDDDGEEEPTDVTALREQLATLRRHQLWMSA